jgi:hypothetical protein
LGKGAVNHQSYGPYCINVYSPPWEDKFEYITLVSIDGKTVHSRQGDIFVDATTTCVTEDDITMKPEKKSLKELTSVES